MIDITYTALDRDTGRIDVRIGWNGIVQNERITLAPGDTMTVEVKDQRAECIKAGVPLHSIDAREWVRLWFDTLKNHPSIPQDPETVLTWFSNLIQAGYDHAVLVKACEWREDWEGNWETQCGEMWSLDDGSPADNKMSYCPGCGGKLMQTDYHDPEPEDEGEDE